MNACLHTPRRNPAKGETHTESFVGTALTEQFPGAGRKEGGRGEARCKICCQERRNCTAQHKSKNKVSSLLSGVANATVVPVGTNVK